MKLPDFAPNTVTYGHLLALEKIVASDTPALFSTIEQWNPMAKLVRERFTKELLAIEHQLDDAY